MRKPLTRDISVHVGFGDLRCVLAAEGVSWSPDVASDMISRMSTLWANTLLEAYQYGLLSDEDEESEEYGPTPDRELIDPRITLAQEDGEEDG